MIPQFTFATLREDDSYKNLPPEKKREAFDLYRKQLADNSGGDVQVLNELDEMEHRYLTANPSEFGVPQVPLSRDEAKTYLAKGLPVVFGGSDGGRALLRPQYGTDDIAIDKQLDFYQLRTDGTHKDEFFRSKYEADGGNNLAALKRGIDGLVKMTETAWGGFTGTTADKAAQYIQAKLQAGDEKTYQAVRELIRKPSSLDKAIPDTRLAVAPDDYGAAVDGEAVDQINALTDGGKYFDSLVDWKGADAPKIAELVRRKAQNSLVLQSLDESKSFYTQRLPQNAPIAAQRLWNRVTSKGETKIGSDFLIPVYGPLKYAWGFGKQLTSDEKEQDFKLYAKAMQNGEKLDLSLREHAAEMSLWTGVPTDEIQQTAASMSVFDDPTNLALAGGGVVKLAGGSLRAIKAAGKVGQVARATGAAMEVAGGIVTGEYLTRPVDAVGKALFETVKPLKIAESAGIEMARAGSVPQNIARGAAGAVTGGAVTGVVSSVLSQNQEPSLGAVAVGAMFGVGNAFGKVHIHGSVVGAGGAGGAIDQFLNASRFAGDIAARATASVGKGFVSPSARFLDFSLRNASNFTDFARVTLTPKETAAALGKEGWDWNVYQWMTEKQIPGWAVRQAVHQTRETGAKLLNAGGIGYAFGFVGSGGSEDAAMEGAGMGSVFGLAHHVGGDVAKTVIEWDKLGKHVPGGWPLAQETNPHVLEVMERQIRQRYVSTIEDAYTKQWAEQRLTSPSGINALWDIDNSRAIGDIGSSLRVMNLDDHAKVWLGSQPDVGPGFTEYLTDLKDGADTTGKTYTGGFTAEHFDDMVRRRVDRTLEILAGGGAGSGINHLPNTLVKHFGVPEQAFVLPWEPKERLIGRIKEIAGTDPAKAKQLQSGLRKFNESAADARMAAVALHEGAHNMGKQIGFMRDFSQRFLNHIIDTTPAEDLVSSFQAYMEDVGFSPYVIESRIQDMRSGREGFNRWAPVIADEIRSAVIGGLLLTESSWTRGGTSGAWAQLQKSHLEKITGEVPEMLHRIAADTLQILRDRLKSRGVAVSPIGNVYGPSGEFLTPKWARDTLAGKDLSGIRGYTAMYVLLNEKLREMDTAKLKLIDGLESALQEAQADLEKALADSIGSEDLDIKTRAVAALEKRLGEAVNNMRPEETTPQQPLTTTVATEQTPKVSHVFDGMSPAAVKILLDGLGSRFAVEEAVRQAPDDVINSVAREYGFDRGSAQQNRQAIIDAAATGKPGTPSGVTTTAAYGTFRSAKALYGIMQNLAIEEANPAVFGMRRSRILAQSSGRERFWGFPDDSQMQGILDGKAAGAPISDHEVEVIRRVSDYVKQTPDRPLLVKYVKSDKGNTRSDGTSYTGQVVTKPVHPRGVSMEFSPFVRDDITSVLPAVESELVAFMPPDEFKKWWKEASPEKRTAVAKALSSVGKKVVIRGAKGEKPTIYDAVSGKMVEAGSGERVTSPSTLQGQIRSEMHPRSHFHYVDAARLREKYDRLARVFDGSLDYGAMEQFHLKGAKDRMAEDRRKRDARQEFSAAEYIKKYWANPQAFEEAVTYYTNGLMGAEGPVRTFKESGLTEPMRDAMLRWLAYGSDETNARLTDPAHQPLGHFTLKHAVTGEELKANRVTGIARPDSDSPASMFRELNIQQIVDVAPDVVDPSSGRYVTSNALGSNFTTGNRLIGAFSPDMPGEIKPTTPATPDATTSTNGDSQLAQSPRQTENTYPQDYKTWMRGQAQWMVANMPPKYKTAGEFLNADLAGFRKLAEAYSVANPKPVPPEVDQLAAPSVPEISQPDAAKMQASETQAPEQQRLAEVVQQITETPPPASAPAPETPAVSPAPAVEATPAVTPSSSELTSQNSTPTVSPTDAAPVGEGTPQPEPAKPKVTRSKKRTMLQEIKDMGYKGVDDFIGRDPEGYQQFADRWQRKTSKKSRKQ